MSVKSRTLTAGRSAEGYERTSSLRGTRVRLVPPNNQLAEAVASGTCQFRGSYLCVVSSLLDRLPTPGVSDVQVSVCQTHFYFNMYPWRYARFEFLVPVAIFFIECIGWF